MHTLAMACTKELHPAFHVVQFHIHFMAQSLWSAVSVIRVSTHLRLQRG